MYFCVVKKIIIRNYYIMTMHLVNLAKFSKSIFEFLFVPTPFYRGGGGQRYFRLFRVINSRAIMAFPNMLMA